MNAAPQQETDQVVMLDPVDAAPVPEAEPEVQLNRKMRRRQAKQARRAPGNPKRQGNPLAAFQALHGNHAAQIESAMSQAITERRRAIEAEMARMKDKPIEDEAQTVSMLGYWVALDEYIHGRGSEDHNSSLGVAANLSLMLAERGYCADKIEVIKEAQVGIFRSQLRFRRLQKWGFDAEAIKAIRQMLEVHAQQITQTTFGVIQEAVAEMYRRADDGQVLEEAPA
jgi:hypothetical protein